MIELNGLTKRYGPTLAVDNLSFQVQPGKVTGFLGPNGAGKSTSMRMVLGLDRPTAGRALVDGRPYQELRAPLRVVGPCWTPGRSTRAAAPATTCSPKPAATASPGPGWSRSSAWSAWTPSPSPPWRLGPFSPTTSQTRPPVPGGRDGSSWARRAASQASTAADSEERGQYDNGDQTSRQA